jgi:hypothetical protein
VRLYSRFRTSNNAVNQVLTLARNKKQELQSELDRRESANLNIELNYVRSQNCEEERDVVKTFKNAILEEEMLARGSSDEWIDRPVEKSRLIYKDFHLLNSIDH